MSPGEPNRLQRLRDFIRLVYDRSADDNIFFLASGVTFDIFLAAIPFLLLLLSLAGLVLAPQFHVPQSEVLERLRSLVPPIVDPDLQRQVELRIQEILQRAGSIGLVSGVIFVWFSTRLFGSLRTVLGEVFDLREGPGVIRGKIVDVQMVLLSTVLLGLNVVLTSVVGGLGREGLERLGLEIGGLERAIGFGTAFLFIYLMFLIIFKFVPRKRLRWRTAGIAALFAAVAFELLKVVYGWFLANFADYSTVFLAFAAVGALVIAVYYGTVLFVLGGEVAQVYELRRTIRKQRETFDI